MSPEALSEANFGPSATGSFDFTRVFENAVLSILPSALFLILAPPRLFWLMKEPYKVTKSQRSIFKLVCLNSQIYGSVGNCYSLLSRD
jgi:hypothetical protein